MLIIIRSLILISIYLIFISGLFAQETKTISGIVTDEIQTKNGKIILTRTTHLPRGKTVSGTVTLDPETDNPGKAQKRLKALKGMVFRIGNELILKDGKFTVKLPDSENVPLQVFSPDGDLLQEVPLDLSVPLPTAELKMPKTIRSEFTEKITGNFPGDISQAKVMVGETLAEVIAGNDSELFYKVSDAEAGQQELSLEYGETEVKTPVTLVDLSLQVGKLSLNSGESTYLDVSVVGFEGLQETLVLEIENLSAKTVSL